MSSTLVGKYVEEGSRSAFYRIGKGRGFKEFSTYWDAEYSHCLQTRAAKAGLAPAVYSQVGKIKLTGYGYNGSGEKQSDWGYITQIAKPISCGGNCGCYKCNEMEDKYDSDTQLIVDRLEQECNICYNDNHIGNFGFIRKNGFYHLVCIDFGPESCEEE